MIPRVPPCCTLVFFCPSAPTQHPSPSCHDASSDLPWFPRPLQHFISPSVSCSVKASHLCYQLLFYFSLYHQGCLCLVPLSLRHLDTILRLRGPCHFWATFFFFLCSPLVRLFSGTMYSENRLILYSTQLPFQCYIFLAVQSPRCFLGFFHSAPSTPLVTRRVVLCCNPLQSASLWSPKLL